MAVTTPDPTAQVVAADAPKHTPGPWKIARGEGLLVWSARGLCIADCSNPVAFGPAEKEANARLIAAAPDLLERLHWAVTTADRLAEVTPAGFLRNGIKAGADQCRAAIARAVSEAA